MRRAPLCLLVALLAALPGCGREEQQAGGGDSAQAVTKPAESHWLVAGEAKDWGVQRALRESRADVFKPQLDPAPKPRAAKNEPPPEPPAARIPPPPFAYKGRLTRGAERFAVLTRDGRAYVVRVGELVEGNYRVEAIRNDHVVLANLELAVAQRLNLSQDASRDALSASPMAPVGSTEDAQVMVAGPSQVRVGEQFTLTVGLDSGANSDLESATVELAFDPKLLELGGNRKSASAGLARVDIAGAYMGHPAHAAVEFRVIATAPAATEIRIVPTSIADGQGRNVDVNAPQAHRLKIGPKS